jgi:hypothetical protein
MSKREDIKIEYCPHCKLRSLLWDQKMKLWRCRECRYIYTDSELSECLNSNKNRQRGTGQIFVAPLWVVNILESKRLWKLLICLAVIYWCWSAIQYSGNSIGLAIGLTIPILLLYAVRIILRKFLAGYNGLVSQHRLSQIFYSIRKSSFLRFAIVLATIALLVTVIWSMVAFIYQLPVASSAYLYLLNMLIIIIAQIWLLSWLCGLLKHSRQLSSKPKFAVVFWSLFAAVVFCAFVGISPFSDIKNTMATAITDWWEQKPAETTTEIATEPPAQNLPPPPDNPTYSSTAYDINKDKNPNWVWVNDYTHLASGSGRPIELYENPNATNPTWEQLLSFLMADNTDQMTYVPDSFVCIDFAETLHNNAERSGIRCGLVVLYPMLHACNAFETIDRGLVFIDCTGLSKYQNGPGNEDKIVNIQLGADYIPRFIFSNQSRNTTWTIQDMGTVTRYQICWKAGIILDYQYDYATASTSYIPPYVPPPSFPSPSSSYIPPYVPTPIPPSSVPICRSCCEDQCSKYQGIWHNGCIDDCMKGGTEKWSWK